MLCFLTLQVIQRGMCGNDSTPTINGTYTSMSDMQAINSVEGTANTAQITHFSFGLLLDPSSPFMWSTMILFALCLCLCATALICIASKQLEAAKQNPVPSVSISSVHRSMYGPEVISEAAEVVDPPSNSIDISEEDGFTLNLNTAAAPTLEPMEQTTSSVPRVFTFPDNDMIDINPKPTTRTTKRDKGPIYFGAEHRRNCGSNDTMTLTFCARDHGHVLCGSDSTSDIPELNLVDADGSGSDIMFRDNGSDLSVTMSDSISVDRKLFGFKISVLPMSRGNSGDDLDRPRFDDVRPGFTPDYSL